MVTRARSGQVSVAHPFDGLRAALMACVVAGHVFAPWWLASGNGRVTAFFVLTGFLIVSVLMGEHAKSGRIDVFGFWMKRAARLVPPVIVMLALISVVAVAATVPGSPAAGPDVTSLPSLWAATLSQSVAAQAAAGFDVPFEVLPQWSINIEWVFYAVCPLLVAAALFFRVRMSMAAAVSAVVAAGLFVWSAVLASDVGAMSVRVLYGTDTRAGAFFVGAAVAFGVSVPSWRARVVSWAPVAAPVAAFGLVALLTTVVVDVGPSMTMWGQVLVSVVAAVLFACVWVCRSPVFARACAFAGFGWVAARSYGLFLFHVPCLHLVGGSSASSASKWVAVACAVACADVSLRFVERPLMAAAKRWQAGRGARRPVDLSGGASRNVQPSLMNDMRSATTS